MNLSKNDITFTAIMIAIIIFLSGAICWHRSYRISKSGDEEPVGIVTYRYHIVMRKYSNRLVWEDVDSETQVYLYDSILTKDQSDANVKLDNGFSLDIDANSMIEIELIDGKPGVRLQYGTIHVTGNNPDGFIVLKDGSILSFKEANVLIAQSGGKSFIAVKDGSIEIKKNGKTQKVNSGQNVRLAPDGNIRVEEVNIKSNEPNDGHIISTKQESVPIQLQWDAPAGTKDHEVIIGKDGSFSKYFTSKPNKPGTLQTKLPPGDYYWQVRAKKGKDQYVSAPRSFHIRKKEKYKIYSPIGKVSADQENTVFAWQVPKAGTPVRIRVSKNKDLSAPLIDRQVSNGRFIYPELPAGKYYWGLSENYPQKSKNTEKKENENAQIYSFIKEAPPNEKPLDKSQDSNLVSDSPKKDEPVQETKKDTDLQKSSPLAPKDKIAQKKPAKNEGLKSPLIKNKNTRNVKFLAMEPANNKTFLFFEGDQKGAEVHFRWKLNKAVDRVRFQLSNKPSFSSLKINHKTSPNKSLFLRDLKPGKYYWRITPLDKNGKAMGKTQAASFVVKKRNLPPPPKVISAKEHP